MADQVKTGQKFKNSKETETKRMKQSHSYQRGHTDLCITAKDI